LVVPFPEIYLTLFLADVKRKRFMMAKDDFLKAGYFLPDAQGDYVRAIAKAILKAPNTRLSMDSPVIQSHYKDLFPDLIRRQVFAHHIVDGSLSFESQLSESFAKSLKP
jgi:hypothetical protein